jgi:hypothetical protein
MEVAVAEAIPVRQRVEQPQRLLARTPGHERRRQKLAQPRMHRRQLVRGVGLVDARVQPPERAADSPRAGAEEASRASRSMREPSSANTCASRPSPTSVNSLSRIPSTADEYG